jgi:hypothetical protein
VGGGLDFFLAQEFVVVEVVGFFGTRFDARDFFGEAGEFREWGVVGAGVVGAVGGDFSR